MENALLDDCWMKPGHARTYRWLWFAGCLPRRNLHMAAWKQTMQQVLPQLKNIDLWHFVPCRSSIKLVGLTNCVQPQGMRDQSNACETRWGDPNVKFLFNFYFFYEGFACISFVEFDGMPAIQNFKKLHWDALRRFQYHNECMEALCDGGSGHGHRIRDAHYSQKVFSCQAAFGKVFF